MLIDPKAKELTFSVALGEKGGLLKKNLRIKIGQGIAGSVAKSGHSILVNNAQSDPRFYGNADKISGFKTKSIMCVPLKAKNKILGVIEAVNSRRKYGFTKEDLQLFQAFACQIAVAIDNARMHEEDLARQHLTQELEIARFIQQNLLNYTPDLSGIHIDALNIPAKQVGGDLYDCFPLGNGKVGVMISDVSGKGIPAALYMVRVKSLFRFEAKSENNIGNVLERINNILSHKPVLGMFVTLCYIIVDTRNMKITYASAGHPPPIYYSKEDDSFTYLDKAQNPPIGITPGFHFATEEITFKKDGTILLYTDGVIEAKNKNGEYFSNKILENSIAENCDNNLLGNISAALKAHTGNSQLSDDCTMMALKM